MRLLRRLLDLPRYNRESLLLRDLVRLWHDDSGGIRLSSGWIQRLRCVKCHEPFKLDGWGDQDARKASRVEVKCSACKVTYSVEDGILNFGVSDPFYDEHGFTRPGRDFSSGLIGKLGLYFSRHHYLNDISRAIAPGSTVIEVGCGGGSRYLASHFDTLGVEVSATSVRHAAGTYQSVAQATSARLPVLDGCADAIVSSYVLEHFEDDIIDQGLSEMARVLKPGGVMIHCFDIDNDGPFHRWARKQTWYSEVFVTKRGHFGLRSLDEWRNLFVKTGFEVEASRCFCKTWLQDLSIWGHLDDPSVGGIPRCLGKVSGAIRKTTGSASDVVVTLLDDCVDRWLPEDWASKVIMQLRKRA